MSPLSYIKNLIGLPYRPVNIDTDAAAVLSSATRAVKHILDFRAAMDRKGLCHVPLIVGNGENHAMVSNKPHHMLVVGEVMKREDVAVAFEMPHDYFFRKLRNSEYAGSVEKIKAMDIESGGALSLKANVVMNLDHRAPFGSFTFKHMLLRHKIKTCFCDVSGTADPYFIIDKTDPSSLDSVRFFFGDELPDRIDMIYPDGFTVRTHHLAKMTMAFAAACRARVVFLQTGDGHVIGWEGEDFENKNGTKFSGKDLGLDYFFRQMASPYVGLVLNGIAKFRKDPAWKDETIFVGNGLPQISATYNPVTGRPREEEVTSNIRSEVAESIYLNGLLSRIGLSSESVMLKNKQKIRAEYSRDLESAIIQASGRTIPKPG